MFLCNVHEKFRVHLTQLHGFADHILYMQAGFVNRNEPVAKVRPGNFEEAAKRACETKLEDAKSAYRDVKEDNLPFLCMDLVYQFTLLVNGFGRFHSIMI